MKKALTVRDVPANLFISIFADFLKKSGRIEIPSWLNIVKTGISKNNAPNDPDWFFFRLAALARKFYLNQGKGVGSMRKEFGRRKRNGSRPAKKSIASGKILRVALKELEKFDIIFKNEEGKRFLTKKAQNEMDIRAEKIILSIKKYKI